MDNFKEVFNYIQESIYGWWKKNFIDETGFWQKYYVKFFKREGTSYGVSYNLQYYIIFFVASISIVFLVAYLSQLNWIYIIVLIAASIIMFPILIVAFINQQNELRRFEQVTSYLTNILPIFMQKTKILWALKEVEPLLKYRIQEVVKDAIDYIENNTTDTNAEKTALGLIEIEFPNSRVTAVNKLMLTIENDNSVDYENSCLIMYDDVENWIDRVASYQKDLKNRRTQLMLLCIMTVGMNILFISMYQSNEFFAGFGKLTAYQITTTLFLVSIMIVITLTIIKLHGAWIVNDNTTIHNEKVEKAYSHLNDNFEIRKIDLIASAILLALSVFLFVAFDNKILGLFCFGGFILLLLFRFIQKYSYESTVKKALSIEFPMWLRTVSLNLYNMTVLQAIDRSKIMVTYVFAKELEKFQKMTEKDPVSIKPYMSFLQEYKIMTAAAAMKVLYSIQNIGAEGIKTQITSLVQRNQKLLQKSEEIRNKDNIAGIELLGFIPMVLFTIEMLVSLFLLILQVVGQMTVDLKW